MKFKNKDNLSRHVKQVHEQQKNHQCDNCKKMFFTKNKLLKHVKIHTGQKDFSCKFCEKGFVQKINRDTHEKRVHSSLI